MDGLAVGSGRSRADDALDAGWFAASEAVAGLRGARPGLVLVYGSPHYDLAQVTRAVRDLTGDAPLIGASTGGQVCDGEYLPAGAGVAVLALGAGRYRFGTAALPSPRHPTEAGRWLAGAAMEAAVGPDDRPAHGALLLMSAGVRALLSELVSGAHAGAGPGVPVLAGMAAGEPGSAVVLADGEVIDDGVVAVYIASDEPLRVVAPDGQAEGGLPGLVATDGSDVHELSAYGLGVADGDAPGSALAL